MLDFSPNRRRRGSGLVMSQAVRRRGVLQAPGNDPLRPAERRPRVPLNSANMSIPFTPDGGRAGYLSSTSSQTLNCWPSSRAELAVCTWNCACAGSAASVGFSGGPEATERISIAESPMALR